MERRRMVTSQRRRYVTDQRRRQHLLDRGVHVIPRGLLYVSTAHRPADIAATADAMAGAASEIVAERQEVRMA
jgi:glutamate-1-semialdehyde aminotransferase